MMSAKLKKQKVQKAQERKETTYLKQQCFIPHGAVTSGCQCRRKEKKVGAAAARPTNGYFPPPLRIEPKRSSVKVHWEKVRKPPISSFRSRHFRGDLPLERTGSSRILSSWQSKCFYRQGAGRIEQLSIATRKITLHTRRSLSI